MTRGYGRTEAGAALMELIVLTFAAGFKLRALGRRTGLVSARGGVWGLLNSLSVGGPQTVPALARSRPVARQHIQQLADAMAAEGLVAFRPNPAHRRSSLVALTRKGEEVFEALTRKFAAMSDDLAADMDARRIAAAAETLKRLIAKVDAGLGGADANGKPLRRKRM